LKTDLNRLPEALLFSKVQKKFDSCKSWSIFFLERVIFIFDSSATDSFFRLLIDQEKGLSCPQMRRDNVKHFPRKIRRWDMFQHLFPEILQIIDALSKLAIFSMIKN
jgi:hypothetical protein